MEEAQVKEKKSENKEYDSKDSSINDMLAAMTQQKKATMTNLLEKMC